MTLTDADIGRLRMTSLLLAGPATGASVQAVAEHFLAMQAQDAPGLAWSLGYRTGLTESQVHSQLQTRALVRTWPMRGTLHLIPSADAHWMLELCASKTLSGFAKRREFLGLDPATADRAVEVLTHLTASAPEPVSRATCLAALNDAGIPTDGGRGYHLLTYAATLAVVAGGPPRGKEGTFVHLDSWTPERRSPDREEALALVAGAYVRGHGPVSDKELARWTGLGLRDSRAGLAAAEATVAVETERGPMWAAADALDALPTTGQALLAAGFDELMLGYSEAERPVEPQYLEAIAPGKNGVFKRTVVVDGRVVGTWEKAELTTSVRVTIAMFGTATAAQRKALTPAAERYATYVGRALDLRWV